MGSQLKNAMERGGKSMENPADAFKESATLLTQKREPAPEPVAQPSPKSASPLLAGNAAPASRAPARASLTLASVRFSDSTLKSVIKDINLTEVRVLAKRDQAFPGILDQAVVDIEIAEWQMARLNGYVHQLQAVDKRQDTEFVSVTIRFVDEDPKKLEDLSRFVARFRAGSR